MNIEQVVKRILSNGPDRVMFKTNEATTLNKAIKKYKINPDIIFIRNDGWSIGAPTSLEGNTYRSWENEWTHYIIKPERKARPIAEYKDKHKKPIQVTESFLKDNKTIGTYATCANMGHFATKASTSIITTTVEKEIK